MNLQDLAFAPATTGLLERLKAPGRVLRGGAQTRPNNSQPLDFTDDWGGAQPGEIRFFVPGRPQGKGRPRAARRGNFVTMYTPKKTATYESTVALFASQAMSGHTQIDGPVRVRIYILCPIAASWTKKKQTAACAGEIYPTGKPDSDNVVKALFDAMNGVVWRDDVQVVDIALTKRYSSVPGVFVGVSLVETGR